MSRLARLIVPDFPHHVTQRGIRRAPVFFEDGDYALYRDEALAPTEDRELEAAE